MLEGGSDFIRITLSFHQRQMVRFIAERGGETPYTFGRVTIKGGQFSDEERKRMAVEADNSMRDMCNRLNLITMTQLIGPTYAPDTWLLKLTDIGRNVLDQMKISVRQNEFRINLATGKEIKGL